MTTAEDGRATLRDVAQAQKETRQEIGELREEVLGRIDGVDEKLDAIKDGLIPRVSILEEQRRADRAILDDHEIRLLKVETAHQRALGHIGAWKVAGSIFGGAATIVIADIIFKALGG